MKTEMTLSIWVIFFTVYLADPVLGVEDNTICCKNVSHSIYRTTSYREVKYKPRWWPLPDEEEYITRYNNALVTVWKWECYSDKDNKTGTCRCKYGWEGNFCNEPLFCIISQSVQPKAFEAGALHDLLASNETENLLSQLVKYPCLPECSNQINNTDINCTQSGNMIHHFVPIHSPCNTVAGTSAYWIFLKENKYIIGGVIGIIILLIIIVCMVCIVRSKKRRRINAMDNELLDEGNVYVEIDLIKSCKLT